MRALLLVSVFGAAIAVACSKSVPLPEGAGASMNASDYPAVESTVVAGAPRKEDFVAAGLTDDQAVELVAGLRHVEQETRLRPDAVRAALRRESLMNAVVLDAAPRLADGIKRGAIAVEWEPRAKPTRNFEGVGLRRDTKSDAAGQYLWFSARGRTGTLTLRLPETVCAAQLWDEMEDAERGRQR
jgi:hypothetical protein